MRKDNIPTISNVDMNEIYKEVLIKTEEDCLRDDFPDILVFENQPSDIVRYEMPNGRSILGIRNGRNICKKIISEIRTPKAEQDDAPEFMVHSMDSDNVSRLYCVVVLLSEMLKIPCPQIQFRKLPEDLHGWAEYEKNLVVLGEVPNEESNLLIRFMAHEFRHLWQHKYRPEYSEGYIKSADSIDGYFNCMAEIDAEAWASKLCLGIFDEDDITDNPEYNMGDDKSKQKVLKLRDKLELNESCMYRLKRYLGMLD